MKKLVLMVSLSFGVLVSSIFLSACGGSGGGGGGGTTVVDKTSGQNSIKSSSRSILPGDVCEFGGVEIETGIDANSNGVLDSDEVDETLVVCNGDYGYNSLIGLNDEPAGVNCSSGGVRIDSGLDENRNDVLDDIEIAETKYVCNGADGVSNPNATTGENGLNTLLTTTDEPAGVNCSSGGLRIDSGLDENRNDILDDVEIAETNYICNGADGTNGADNSAIASIFCNGTLSGFSNISWSYSLHQLSSGDVIVEGEIIDEFITASKTNYYSFYQAGFLDASVVVSHDVLGSFNYGFWKLSLNRNTLVTTIKYNDSDLITNPTVWTMNSSQCILNSY